jgi:hypothetical protein
MGAPRALSRRRSRVRVPSLPLFTHRRFSEEGGERGFGAHGDDALVVDPDALEEVLE